MVAGRHALFEWSLSTHMGVIITATSNDRHGVSNYRSIECLFSISFRLTTSKVRVTVPLWGECTGDRWIPAQRDSNAEKNSIWWRHNDGVSTHTQLDYWFNSFFSLTTEKNTKAPQYWPIVWGIRGWLMDSPHKGHVMRKMFQCRDVSMGPNNVPYCQWRPLSSYLAWPTRHLTYGLSSPGYGPGVLYHGASYWKKKANVLSLSG